MEIEEILNIQYNTEDIATGILKLGLLIDYSNDFEKPEYLDVALEIGESLLQKNISHDQKGIICYFLANLWSSKNKFLNHKLLWNSKELEKTIYYYHLACEKQVISSLPENRQCQIYTNFANILRHIGRFIEAIEYWNEAIRIDPNFSIAIGNKGNGIINYADLLYDNGHSRLFKQSAYHLLKQAIEIGKLEGQVRNGFVSLLNDLESSFPLEILQEKEIETKFPLGDSESEIRYREWCLNNNLFLNPLNDIGNYSIAANDILFLPHMQIKFEDGFYYQSLLNGIKQEFIAARFLVYEGINKKVLHFADKDTFLYSLGDHTFYSINIEKIKMGYRSMYSLLDKLSHFLNRYFHLEVPPNKLSLKRIWYKKNDPKQEVRDVFNELKNWGFRGLFWLSRDLFELNDANLPMDPEAYASYKLRNSIEHNFTKILDPVIEGLSQNHTMHAYDSTNITYDQLVKNAIKLSKLVRSAFIYLILGINIEEQKRESECFVSMEMPYYDDKFKSLF
ncbi:hypothetical protein EHQ24_08165 [Leptospira noumeaensis]|uniref:LA2681-like HEPN domain-containing protein n=1 Tax=Leptospira noumeaensis TaxID=2484964 RepID=A0A4R9I955_9LEPT|nr:LA2681 family HEPN domain-containing protein [Leptospira noumeaensis]TGK82986.1 hypothetical protein EHQ24_08165 [Leptospira noumeaensis]